MTKKYAKRATTEAFFNFIEQPRRKVDIEEEFSSFTFYEKRNHTDVESAKLWCVNGTRFMQAVHYFKRGTNPPSPVNIPFDGILDSWVSTRDIATEVGISTTSVGNDLKHLLELGLIEMRERWVKGNNTAYNLREYRYKQGVTVPPFKRRVSYVHTKMDCRPKTKQAIEQMQEFANDPLKFAGCEMWRRRELWATYPDLGWLAKGK